MTETVTYTSAARVQGRAHNMSANVSTDEISTFIVDAEDLIDGVMKYSFKGSFDTTKHSLLQAAATVIAALSAVAADPSTFSDLPEAQGLMDVLWAESWRFLTLLSDTRTVEWLKQR